MNRRIKNNTGFTFIETAIVISIIALIVAIALFSYRHFEIKTELGTTAQKILAVLKTAQTRTLASEKASQYGVHFENDEYILFQGDVYLEGAIDNKIYQLPSRLEINAISLTGGGNDVVFQKINGQTTQDGTIVLRIIAQPTESETINIHNSGQIELASVLGACCNTNRLTDGRHIHLDLGWSIQSSNTLTLYFLDAPETIIDVPMADYFNIDKTDFNWTEVIEVNGENQELTIHAHSLDDINTILCIHRNGDKNNKPLQILIDDKDIVSYTADGQPTIGFWGGAIEIQ